jgi:hypothetical protein
LYNLNFFLVYLALVNLPIYSGKCCELLCVHCYEEASYKKQTMLQQQINDLKLIYQLCHTKKLEFIITERVEQVKFFDAVTEWYLINCVANEDLTFQQIKFKIILETAGKNAIIN